MPAAAPKPQLVAFDTNVLLDRAAEDETVLDALATVGRKLVAPSFIITPTVIEEIALKAERGDTLLDKRLARKVVSHLLEWRIRPMSFIPVGRGIAAEIASRIRGAGLIPDEELNDSFSDGQFDLLCALGVSVVQSAKP
jgi:hypothetical protein